MSASFTSVDRLLKVQFLGRREADCQAKEEVTCRFFLLQGKSEFFSLGREDCFVLRPQSLRV